MSPSDLLHKFVKGLKPAVQKEVELRDPKTWEEAVRMAERADAVFYRFGGESKSSKTEQPKKVNVNNIQAKGSSSRVICWNCEKPGHLKRNCPLLKAKRQ